jgi:hypothetical protein
MTTPTAKKIKKVTPVKKTVVKRKETATPSASSPKKTAPKKAVKAAPKPKVAEVTSSAGREFDAHGFVVGSDSSKIVAELLAGGSGRSEVSARIESILGGATRYGNDKNVSSLVSGLLGRLKERGYTVEQTWRLVPPSTSGPQKAAKVSKGTGTKAKVEKAATRRPAARKTRVTKATAR